MHLANPSDLIVINDANKILLVKINEKDDSEFGKWSIPGGGAEEGESFEDAVKREIFEELGCEIETFDYFRSYYYPAEDARVRAVYFFGKIKGNITLSEEHSKYEWFGEEEIKNLEIAANQKEVLLDFLKFYRGF